MQYLLEIAKTGLTAILLHPLRSLVTISALVVALFPYLVGLGISRGIQEQAEAAVRHGGDLYVTGQQFGRPVPIPLTAAGELAKLPGVASVTPRIVGRIELGKDRISAVVVGMPPNQLAAAVECVEGRLHGPSGRLELVIGSDLARRLSVTPGTVIPPFYRNRQGEHVAEVVGVFRSELPLWQARLVLTSLDSAAEIFDQPGLVSDVVVNCRPGYQAEVEQAIGRHTTLFDAEGAIRPHVVTRDELATLLPRGQIYREGVFTLLFTLALVVAMLVILVTSGFGTPERRREIAILKATGWQTDELLLRSLVESLILALAGASIAVLLAAFWLQALNGYWIAGIFLYGVDAEPGFRVPFRLLPTPVLLAFLIALVVVMSGSLHSTWRAATTPPREAMR